MITTDKQPLVAAPAVDEHRIASDLARRAFDHEHSSATLALSIPADLARRAFAGTSFDPEGRARRAIAGYGAELKSDTEHMRAQAVIGGTTHLVEAEVTRYAAGYHQRVVALLHSESRCVSSFIAGPANFPVRRMQIRADIARARAEDLAGFRRSAMKVALRVLRPDLRPIMAGDEDAIDRLELELERAERKQEQMKAVNVVIRSYAKAGADHQVAALMERGMTEAEARDALKPDFANRVGFPSYKLTNNGANIRRMRQRLDHLRTAKAMPVTETAGAAGVRVQDDPPANRVRLFFPDKPDKAIRQRMSDSGFRWTPTLGAWQAYRNHTTLSLARELSGQA